MCKFRESEIGNRAIIVPLFVPLLTENRLAGIYKAVLRCPGRESNPHGRFGPRDFLASMAFATGFSKHYRVSVWSPDYSFTMDFWSLGVSCLVSAPSSKRLGSRLPSALSVKASLNLRHSTSLLSGRALKFSSPSCLPFHHQGKCHVSGSQRYVFFPRKKPIDGNSGHGLDFL